MSIYMELRCELRGELPINESKCWSEVDRSLWAMALNTHESTEQTTTELLSKATHAGWQSINGDWICPGCQENLALTEQMQAVAERHDQ
ncbi:MULTISPECIES: hypothetical protein [Enterobacterales]|jgi:hypothetical protein|uniref:Uncharacterized protein n=1 Tax=Serratia marcescens TaxID=615 RepID=A0A8X6EN73_SERMA|nr:MULTISPECIES: hypothetical protein [Enterobacterales]HBA8456196.1 hypothetical protein [Escherichia coli]MBJ2078289.1 hypothetical protein [Serratia ureilytica]MDL4454841.1 hypothetical protein [Klebsiella michiganensis]MDM3535920.1 hypothetical protein [Serratia marcescens]MDP0522220.1 hypothetical protein [Serratia marcescens]